MEIPQMTWAEVPWWAWVLIVLPVWYVAVGRVMARHFPEPGAARTDRVVVWLFSPFTFPIVAVIACAMAAVEVLWEGVKWACVIFPPDPETRKDADSQT